MTATLPGTINRDSPVPFYFQLAELLEEEITSRRWESGRPAPLGAGALPALRRVADDDSPGPGAARAGGTAPAGQGPRHVRRRHAPPLLADPVDRGVLLRRVPPHGPAGHVEILRLEERVLPRWASGALQLATGSEGVMLERLRLVDGLTALYVVNYLPSSYAEVVLGHDRATRSTAGSAREAAVRMHGGRRFVEAVTAGAAARRRCSRCPGDAVALRRVGLLDDGCALRLLPGLAPYRPDADRHEVSRLAGSSPGPPDHRVAPGVDVDGHGAADPGARTAIRWRCDDDADHVRESCSTDGRTRRRARTRSRPAHMTALLDGIDLRYVGARRRRDRAPHLRRRSRPELEHDPRRRLRPLGGRSRRRLRGAVHVRHAAASSTSPGRARSSATPTADRVPARRRAAGREFLYNRIGFCVLHPWREIGRTPASAAQYPGGAGRRALPPVDRAAAISWTASTSLFPAVDRLELDLAGGATAASSSRATCSSPRTSATGPTRRSRPTARRWPSGFRTGPRQGGGSPRR